MALKQTKRDPMLKIIGDYPEDLPRSEENLTLRFSPSKTSIQQRWRNNGLSADFIADYLMTFFLGNDQEDSQNLLLEIKTSTAYIANELLENAMKYNDESSHQAIVFSLNLYTDQLVFLTANSIGVGHIIQFQDYIQELLDNDPEDLFFSKLEQEDESPLSKGAGLGLLTMMIQHQAKLGWKFERLEAVDPTPPLVTTVTTSVCLPIGSSLTKQNGSTQQNRHGKSHHDGN
jgi:hypothetical protein